MEKKKALYYFSNRLSNSMLKKMLKPFPLKTE